MIYVTVFGEHPAAFLVCQRVIWRETSRLLNPASKPKSFSISHAKAKSWIHICIPKWFWYQWINWKITSSGEFVLLIIQLEGLLNDMCSSASRGLWSVVPHVLWAFPLCWSERSVRELNISVHLKGILVGWSQSVPATGEQDYISYHSSGTRSVLQMGEHLSFCACPWSHILVLLWGRNTKLTE